MYSSSRETEESKIAIAYTLKQVLWTKFLVFLLGLPTVIKAEEHPCQLIAPSNYPKAAIAACTDQLLIKTLGIEAQAEALLVRGIALRELGKFDRSVADLEASLDLAKDTGTMRMLAWTYREMGKYEEAERLYTEVLKTDKHPQGWLSRCVVRIDQRYFDKAVEDCEEALKQEPENTDALFFTANAYTHLNKPDLALQHALKGLNLRPNEVRFHIEYVWALYLSGRTNLARKLALEALEQFQNDPDLDHFLKVTVSP